MGMHGKSSFPPSPCAGAPSLPPGAKRAIARNLLQPSILSLDCKSPGLDSPQFLSRAGCQTLGSACRPRSGRLSTYRHRRGRSTPKRGQKRPVAAGRRSRPRPPPPCGACKMHAAPFSLVIGEANSW